MNAISYLGPTLALTLGDIDASELLRSFEVRAACGVPAAVCDLDVADPDGNLRDALSEDDRVELAWGQQGENMQPIFRGLVARTRRLRGRNELLLIECVDAMKKLFDARISKTFQEERPATILRNLVEPLDIDASGIDEVDALLDRLPLHDDHIVHAARTMTRRLGLDYDLWCSIDRVLHWHGGVPPRSSGADPVASFVEGENLIELDVAATLARVLTLATTLFPGDAVALTTREQEATSWYVHSARHFQGEGQGPRSEFVLMPIVGAAA